jgi:hypothetical protein
MSETAFDVFFAKKPMRIGSGSVGIKTFYMIEHFCTAVPGILYQLLVVSN